MSKNGNTKTKNVRKDQDTLSNQEARAAAKKALRALKRKAKNAPVFVDVSCKSFLVNLDGLYTRFYRLIPRQWQMPEFYEKFDEYAQSMINNPDAPREHEKIFSPIYEHLLTRFDGLSEHAKLSKWGHALGGIRSFGLNDPVFASLLGFNNNGDRQIEFTLPYS